jgi:hypothetical protein
MLSFELCLGASAAVSETSLGANRVRTLAILCGDGARVGLFAEVGTDNEAGTLGVDAVADTTVDTVPDTGGLVIFLEPVSRLPSLGASRASAALPPAAPARFDGILSTCSGWATARGDPVC